MVGSARRISTLKPYQTALTRKINAISYSLGRTIAVIQKSRKQIINVNWIVFTASARKYS